MNYFLIIVLVIVVLWLLSTYNFFVSSIARIKASVQEIGNQLKRQMDLIPNLEASVKGYLKHEKGIFDELTNARKAVAGAVKSGNLQEMADAGSKFASLLPKIQVVVESTPELKASSVVENLMDELRDTADKIMYARRLLIDLTADFNVKRVSVPANIVAKIFNIAEQPGLITQSKDTKTPKIDL
jgi:LemA protein